MMNNYDVIDSNGNKKQVNANKFQGDSNIGFYFLVTKNGIVDQVAYFYKPISIILRNSFNEESSK